MIEYIFWCRLGETFDRIPGKLGHVGPAELSSDKHEAPIGEFLFLNLIYSLFFFFFFSFCNSLYNLHSHSFLLIHIYIFLKASHQTPLSFS